MRIGLFEEPATDLGRFSVDGAASDTVRRVDEYKGLVILESPEVYSGWRRNCFRVLLSYVHESSTGNEEIALRVSTISFDGWNMFDSAYLLGGRRLDVSRIASDVDCSRAGCSSYETTAVILPQDVFRGGGVSGMKFQLAGRQQIEIEIPAALVAGFLRRVDEERANLRTKPPGP